MEILTPLDPLLCPRLILEFLNLTLAPELVREVPQGPVVESFLFHWMSLGNTMFIYISILITSGDDIDSSGPSAMSTVNTGIPQPLASGNTSMAMESAGL